MVSSERKLLVYSFISDNNSDYKVKFGEDINREGKGVNRKG